MDIIKYIMIAFALIASIDRIFGNRFGLGKEFERGLMLTGASILSMTGMLVLAPMIADLLTPFCFAFPKYLKSPCRKWAASCASMKPPLWALSPPLPPVWLPLK